MKKDFNLWNDLEQKINNEKPRVLFHEREIWWCSIGVNVGFEQDGKNETFERPVLIFRKFNKEIFWALPITTKSKPGKYYFNYNYNGKTFSIILSQLRLLDCKRLLRKIRVISQQDFKELEYKLNCLIKQTTPPCERSLGGRSRL